MILLLVAFVLGGLWGLFGPDLLGVTDPGAAFAVSIMGGLIIGLLVGVVGAVLDL